MIVIRHEKEEDPAGLKLTCEQKKPASTYY